MVLGFTIGGRCDIWDRGQEAGQDMQDRQTDAWFRQEQARETVLGRR